VHRHISSLLHHTRADAPWIAPPVFPLPYVSFGKSKKGKQKKKQKGKDLAY
jgi:hypothetical protein